MLLGAVCVALFGSGKVSQIFGDTLVKDDELHAEMLYCPTLGVRCKASRSLVTVRLQPTLKSPYNNCRLGMSGFEGFLGDKSTT